MWQTSFRLSALVTTAAIPRALATTRPHLFMKKSRTQITPEHAGRAIADQLIPPTRGHVIDTLSDCLRDD